MKTIAILEHLYYPWHSRMINIIKQPYLVSYLFSGWSTVCLGQILAIALLYKSHEVARCVWEVAKMLVFVDVMTLAYFQAIKRIVIEYGGV